MSVLATVLIAIAAAFVGFIIGLCVGVSDAAPNLVQSKSGR